MNNKRKTFRVGIAFPVTCMALPERRTFYSVLKNVSLGGVEISSESYLCAGKSFKLNIDLVDKTVEVKAKVIWCCIQNYSDDYYVGFQFEELSGDNKRTLRSLFRQLKIARLLN